MKHAIVCSVLLALIVPGMLLAQAPTPQSDFPAWLDGKLKEMADTTAAPDKRIAARDAVIKEVVSAPPQAQTTLCGTVTSKIPAFIGAADPTTCIHACKLAASVKHVYLVPELAKGISSTNQVVRYWSAKGLADVQMGMYRMANDNFFDQPIKALAEQGVKETSCEVLKEIYRALGVSDPGKMDRGKQNARIYQALMNVWNVQHKRLANRKLDMIPAEMMALASASQWAKVYANDKVVRKEIAGNAGQVLAWASQIYVLDAEELTDQQKGQLEHLLLRSGSTVAACLTRQDVDAMAWKPADDLWQYDAVGRPLEQWEKRGLGVLHGTQFLLREGKAPEMALHVLSWVGGPDMKDYKLKPLGVAPAAGLNPKKQPAEKTPETTPAQ